MCLQSAENLNDNMHPDSQESFLSWKFNEFYTDELTESERINLVAAYPAKIWKNHFCNTRNKFANFNYNNEIDSCGSFSSDHNSYI